MAGKRWTKTNEAKLFAGAGAFGQSWFQRNTGHSWDYPNAPLGRSKTAVANKAYRLGVRLRQGTYALTQLKRETGYTEDQFRRAGSALNQNWKRLSPKGPYMVTEEQREDLLDWLTMDFWSKRLRLYGCVKCGTEKRAHKSFGLCVACYFRMRTLCERYGLSFGKKALRDALGQIEGRAPELEERIRRKLDRGISPHKREIRALGEVFAVGVSDG